jgi:cobaltochelatase CobS
MTKPTTDDLRKAYGLGGYSATRAELRKLVSPMLEVQARHTDLAGLIDSSPICGDEPHQMKVRPTWSAIRDALDLDTLTALCMGSVKWTDVTAAIYSPATDGTPSTTSKSGYTFGRPNSLTSEMVAANNAAVMGDAEFLPTVAYEPSTFGLQDVIEVHDHIVERCEVSTNDAFSAMRKYHSTEEWHDKCSAAQNMVGLRGDWEISAYSELPERVKNCIALTELQFDDVDAPTEPEAPTTVAKYELPAAAESSLIDLALKNAKLPSIATLIEEINGASAKIAEAQAKAEAEASLMASASAPTVASGAYPSGKVRLKVAADVFGFTGAKRKTFDFKIPVWEWDAPHPLVPAIDENYIFRAESLLMVLYSIITNQPAWLHGHTGCGKTTKLEQVAAYTNFPFMRVNFDSEISRADLIGRDTLVNDGGATASTFVEGILPQMLQTPCIACFDECDFMRADVAYVMQRSLEGNGLLLTEDGGRLIKPHPMFRAFATANTVGQGDEFGMYQGARVQSQAFLNRFKTFVHVPYMTSSERRKLITSHHKLKADTLDKVCKYITEHLEAFTNAKVLQPISPRNFMAFSQAIVAFTDMFGDEAKAIEMAFDMTILNACTTQDKAVLKGIGNRVLK